MRPIDFSDLPKFSPWPAILLGLKEFSPKKKTAAEVIREFDREKWSAVLDQLAADENLRAVDIDVSRLAGIELPMVDSGNFYLASGLEALQAQVDHQVRVLAALASETRMLAELGAGYGSIILRLALAPQFTHWKFFAAEYTQSGRRAIELLARRAGLKMSPAGCDFRELTWKGEVPLPGSIIFTSYAAHYVSELPDDFPRFLASMRPAAVVHFEPCYEHCDIATIYGMMCKRYIEINDYNRNLASVLSRSQDRGDIELILEDRQVVGANPFLPMSIFVWRPLSRLTG